MVVAYIGGDVPAAGVGGADIDAVVAAAGDQRAGTRGREECQVAGARQDLLVGVAGTEDDRVGGNVDDIAVAGRQDVQPALGFHELAEFT